MDINIKNKRLWLGAVLFLVFIAFIIVIATNSNKASLKDEETASLKTEIEDQQGIINEQLEQIEVQQEQLDKQNITIADLEEKVKEAEPWFEMTKKEQQKKIEEEKAKEEEEKEVAAKKAKEEEEKKAAEEAQAKKEAEKKEKKGYEIGITFDQVARTPDDFVGEKVKFKGRVVQVIEGDNIIQIRLAIDDDYDKVILRSTMQKLCSHEYWKMI